MTTILRPLTLEIVKDLKKKARDRSSFSSKYYYHAIIGMIEFIDELLLSGYDYKDFQIPSTIFQTHPFLIVKGRRVNRFSAFDLKKFIEIKNIKFI